ncbi:MAG: glutamine synthetase family protein [Granulosicoccus sp.]
MSDWAHFLKQNPQLKSVDVLIGDINGVLRGKRIPSADLHKLFSGELCLPRAMVLLDTIGEASTAIPYGFPDGDPDRPLIALPDTLVPVPWSDGERGQILTLMSDEPNEPFVANSRTVLAQCVDSLRNTGFHPVVAVELEFILFDLKASQLTPASIPVDQGSVHGPQTYHLELMQEHEAFLRDIEAACAAQAIPIGACLSEYGDGQFEINLRHTGDVLKACDQAILLRRVVRQVSRQHGLLASFMAKPSVDNSGNGMHVHVSLLNESGENLFAPANEPLVPALQQAVGGTLALMPSSMALFAPNANSYRRFMPDTFVPLVADWGYDHRAVAVRIPYARAEATRLEHRCAGADANPYLVVAAVLAGIEHGLATQTSPGTPTSGDTVSPDAAVLPCRWREALVAFDSDPTIRSAIGEQFASLYSTVKAGEEAAFHQASTALDYQHYLRTL